MSPKKRGRDAHNFSKKWRKRRNKQNTLIKTIANARIIYLFNWAEQNYANDPEIAHSVIKIARKIAMGAKVQIPLNLKRHSCHGCKKFLKYGVNSRFRTHRRKGYGTWVSLTCLECGCITRYIVKGKAYNLKSKN